MLSSGEQAASSAASCLHACLLAGGHGKTCPGLHMPKPHCSVTNGTHKPCVWRVEGSWLTVWDACREVVTKEVPLRGQLRRPDTPQECPAEIADLIDACELAVRLQGWLA